MLADCELAALLAARKTRADWTDLHVRALAGQWLGALELTGASGLFACARNDGSTALALDRKTCCSHYRRRGGEPCETCPRLAKHERFARLNAARDTACEGNSQDT